MSDDDDDSGPFTFTFTGSVPPFLTRSRHRTFSTVSTETPTDFSTSTPSLSTSFDVSSLPPLTQTDDPSLTDAPPSSTGTLSSPTPTSWDTDPSTLTSTDIFSSVTLPDSSSSTGVPSLDSSLTIDPSTSIPLSDDLSSLTTIPDLLTSTSSDDPLSTFSSTSFDSLFTTDPSSIPDSTSTTSDLSLTTTPPSTSQTPSTSWILSTSSTTSTSPTPSTFTPTSSSSATTPSQSTSMPTELSQILSSSPTSVTTTSLPSFGSSPQSRTSTTSTGVIVAATTGSIALALALALLIAFCIKRCCSKRVRRQASPDPFIELDPDGEGATVNQPLIFGDPPRSTGAVYSDPYTDYLRPRTQSRTLSTTTRPTTGLTRGNNSYQPIAGSVPAPEPGGFSAADYHNQYQYGDRRSPPPHLQPSGIIRGRSPSVETKFSQESAIPRQSSPPYDAGAIAYLRNNGQTTYTSPPSSTQPLPGTTEDHRLISAFSAGSGLSPRDSNLVSPPNIDETWRNSPDPIKASSSYMPLIDRQRSFTPSVSGNAGDHDDVMIIAPPFHMPNRGRPSPILEVSEVTSHSHEGSGHSGGTWNSVRTMDSAMSSPVVMHAQRVRLTPTALSVVSPSTGSLVSVSSNPLPKLPPLPLPELPQVQPLSLGKKRPPHGAS